MRLPELVERAKAAVDAVNSFTGVPPRDTRDALEELQEHVQDKLDALPREGDDLEDEPGDFDEEEELEL